MVQTNAQERFELWNKSDIAEIGGRVEQIPVTAPFQETLRVFKRDGIVVLNDAVSLDVVTGIVDEFNSMMAMTDMEHHFRDKLDSKSGKSILGVLTKRRSEILARSPHLVGQLLTQPRLLELINSHLTTYATSVLIHQVLSVEINPGEVAQPLHRDNGLWPIPGRRIPLGVATMTPLENFVAFEEPRTLRVSDSEKLPLVLASELAAEISSRSHAFSLPEQRCRSYTSSERWRRVPFFFAKFYPFLSATRNNNSKRSVHIAPVQRQIAHGTREWDTYISRVRFLLV